MRRALVSWSGGKDSCFAMQKALAGGVLPVALVSVMNESGEFSRSNGVSREILLEHAEMMSLPVVFVPASWKNYEINLKQALKEAGASYSADCCVFGDIDIEEHRLFEEKVSSEAGLEALLPLWGCSRDELACELAGSGIKAKISVIRKEKVPDRFLGIDYSESIFTDLAFYGIDLLGENGEFHTVVYDSPLFRESLQLEKQRIVEIFDCVLAVFGCRESERKKQGAFRCREEHRSELP